MSKYDILKEEIESWIESSKDMINCIKLEGDFELDEVYYKGRISAFQDILEDINSLEAVLNITDKYE